MALTPHRLTACFWNPQRCPRPWRDIGSAQRYTVLPSERLHSSWKFTKAKKTTNNYAGYRARYSPGSRGWLTVIEGIDLARLRGADATRGGPLRDLGAWRGGGRRAFVTERKVLIGRSSFDALRELCLKCRREARVRLGNKDQAPAPAPPPEHLASPATGGKPPRPLLFKSIPAGRSGRVTIEAQS